MLVVEALFPHLKMIRSLDTSVTIDNSVYSHSITSHLPIIQVFQQQVGSITVPPVVTLNIETLWTILALKADLCITISIKCFLFVRTVYNYHKQYNNCSIKTRSRSLDVMKH